MVEIIRKVVMVEHLMQVMVLVNQHLEFLRSILGSLLLLEDPLMPSQEPMQR